jgi:hypothetical protein
MMTHFLRNTCILPGMTILLSSIAVAQESSCCINLLTKGTRWAGFYSDLGIAELNVYPTGNHGWGYRRSYKFNQAILDELVLWLDQLAQENSI